MANNLAVLRSELSLIPEGAKPELTDGQVKDIGVYYGAQRFGATTSGFTVCKADACQFKTRCPYMRAKVNMDELLDKDCPVEQNLVKMWMEQFAVEMGVDVADTITLSQVRDLAMDMMSEMRVRQKLADADIVIDAFRFFSPQGDVITEPRSHPLFSTLKDILTRKENKLKSLVATPLERSKNRESQVKSMIESLADLKQQMFDSNNGGNVTVVDLLSESPLENWDEVDRQKAGVIDTENKDRRFGDDQAAVDETLPDQVGDC